jgi:hypothetical protein
MGRSSGILVRDAEQGALALLPKSVRLLRDGLGQGAQGLDACCEFEVVSGNAAYQKGERFFLSPEKARRAYLGPQS